jgi:hypothetical protein
MMTNNMDCNDGLVNSATGILKHIQYARIKTLERKGLINN